MSFFEYMMRYLGKDTPAGDLARDMDRDKGKFPVNGDGKVIMDYLFSQGACSGCVDTFIKCYERYVGYELKRYRSEVQGMMRHERGVEALS